MRTNYTVEAVPYEMDKDRARAYMVPNCLRESHLKPGQHVKITGPCNETVLKIIPKFDGDENAVYLPREEIVHLGVRAGDLVTVERAGLDHPACTDMVVVFKKMRKTVERLESLRLILTDKRILKNGETVLGGHIRIKEEIAKITEETKIKIETEESAVFAVGLEKEVDRLKEFIDNAHLEEKGMLSSTSVLDVSRSRESQYLRAPKGILVSGDTGMGKRTLCMYVLQEAGKDWVRVHGNKAKAIEDAFEYAKLNEPCTVWIDRIERHLEEKSTETVTTIERIMEEIYRDRRRIAVIATTNSLSEIPSEIKSACVLDRTIALHAPTLSQRKEQIVAGIKEHAASTGCQIKEKEVDAAAKRTAGFTRGELFLLIRDTLFTKDMQIERAACIEKAQETVPIDESIRALSIIEKTRKCDGMCMDRLMRCIVRTIPSASDGVPAEVPDIRFTSIFGQEIAKEKLHETIIWPLLHKSLFEEVGISPPKGVLLYGPPGCGKTLIAQALANESGSVFLSIRGPEIMGKYVGESEERVRKVFASARAQVPSIIFIDEIDSIAPHRESDGGQVDKRVVSTLLTEMDGVGGAAGVFVLGATNKPWSIDSALMRPGRFDCHVLVDLPDAETRREIIQNKLRKMLVAIIKWGVNENAVREFEEYLANRTSGFTGAELTGMCADLSMCALRFKIQTPACTSETIEEELLRRLKEVAKKTMPRIPKKEIETFRRFASDPMSFGQY
ncbi:transitional endoplasmic reticulum ATPase [Nematocida parisii]|uniref:AAA+ ATPase domain-containing protein n=1 Tax=Nematocida parisii (strain ERTm3) TaxID=935791 RepID=I3EJ43_NEMP3|nr:uncharacterized protein NEPG_02478 [Nematocida parisii ERTm1]EIJ89240.1 hypothetical protein NEQG_00010 [Nematocida parisii ERTm3]KAI5143605.1 transitional endoplasmic reticulum ATPase [Nematocida parisii]EIJ92590.1 hypothetical protein NEPG_02478 [Nematocida parisii ERTm1]KAI5153952.1 transitional endoplasmic reticulum ATPase [Nematocida parisii]KAI5155941.1 transitional endoplasmic reticulum ATPase [Nematocida parisii]|eukprot:XP_013060305.1 hypothetical protein NEPG_02478 [Nematocida parisii ERTm1]